MSYTAVYSLRVRSYELDVYGHVNNAVYMNWLEHGRSRLLQDKGFTYTSIADAWNVRLVTVATTINFRAQLGLDDDLEVRTSVKRMGNSSVTFDQKIVRKDKDGETIAADCETTICFTDPAMKGSKPIPEEFRKLYG
ncbi:MAG: acyl-CoA thioesterase [Planctomycetaceae bacterium]|nr:acyl-CoA thioesterase [Planctomycetaceae bacterium]